MSKKGVFFLLFWAFLQNCSRDLPTFLHECIGNRTDRLSQMVFLEKILIPDYGGLCDQKGRFFLLFGAFLHNSFKDLPNFCMSVEDNKAHRLS